ncbi:hypothetical protein HMPREF2883_04895 [Actinomyces sp. HMSC075C01]|uniref:Uncharacterized protein n=1 Tax=Actinomyces oris TaxID=544580 RepID=A0A1Q8VTA9_9ACTO|nr:MULTISPECIES: hypothetical protein [Actinomyces]OFR54635.1 hypothetical protein HMPREF2883_04895 [Actinomyces sp. HMSC075C01]OLO51325.1 hypothetical protein BKH27_12570 [Actinomyces oris]
MVGFRKKSQDSASFSRSSGAREDGRAGAASTGAPQRTRPGRNEPTARAGKGRRSPAAGRRGYTTTEQMDSRCLTLAESASGVLGRSLDQALARLPDGPGALAASRGPAGPAGSGIPAAGSRPDAVGAPRSTRGRGASTGSVRSTQVGTGQVDTVADIASDIEF